MRRIAVVILCSSLCLALSGCAQTDEQPTATPQPSSQPASASALAAILEQQPDAVKARFAHRHPRQTLEFFGIAPGMRVVEVLPGGGWYSKILIPLLGSEGHLVGADYAADLWPNFGFANVAFLKNKETWTTDWPATARGWVNGDVASIDAFKLGALPPQQHGTADAVLFVRALHNMARFSQDRDFLNEALQNAYDVLKPGGVVGIVQHEARAEMPDSWADGSRGYLKREFVIAEMAKVGFELAAASDVNANERDQPTTEDIVWRLPPGYRNAGDDPQAKLALDAIGESNRMTLKFIKPAS